MVKKDHRSQGPVWKILTGPFIFKITKQKVMQQGSFYFRLHRARFPFFECLVYIINTTNMTKTHWTELPENVILFLVYQLCHTDPLIKKPCSETA